MSKTESKPALLNSLMATGVVISLPSTMSEPGVDELARRNGCFPAVALRFFWVMVMPMVVYLRFVLPLGGKARKRLLIVNSAD